MIVKMQLQEVKIELTNYCKRNCIHCSSDANINNLIELELSDVKRVIDECCNFGVESIVLTGGEATEYQEIEEVVNYIHQKGIKEIKLYTMCEPTTQKYQLLKRLIELGLTEIVYSLTISLTQDKAVTYDNITDFLISISKLTTISFHYCLTKKTIDDLEKLEQVIAKIDIKHFKSLSFLRYVEHGRGKADLTLTTKELKKLKLKLLNFMEKYPNKIHLGSPFNILNITYTPCTAGEKTMIVGFDGNVYPCDAMKYFDYLGSGGDIYSSDIASLYNSPYFQKIRNASKYIADECLKCSMKKCYGGCLAQKMLDMVKRSELAMTTTWYQENALRTMNLFDDETTLKINAHTGILGESGEFLDYIKKLYTHNLSPEKKEEIMALAPKELGDLVWYLTTSMAQVYHYTLNEIYEYILHLKAKHYQIDDDLIRKASTRKDPLCSFCYQEPGYNIDSIYLATTNKYRGLERDNQLILQMVFDFSNIMAKLNCIESKEEAIIVVSEMLVEIAEISKDLFQKNLSEILMDNIEKLRIRYPEGFDKNIADLRIDANSKYKQEQAKKRVRTKPSI